MEIVLIYLHNPRNWKFVIIIVTIRAFWIFAVLLSAVGAPFPLHPLWFQRTAGDSLLTFDTLGDDAFLDIFHDLISRDLVLAFETGGRGKGTMALYDLVWSNSGIGFNIVDVLSVVRQ